MVQANRSNIQVQLSVDLSALNKESVSKPTEATNFATILGEAKTFGAANGLKYKHCQMRYNDGENWVIVEDEQDLELAYACASRSDNKITFTISSMKGQKRGPKAERKKKEKFMGKSVPRWAFKNLITNEQDNAYLELFKQLIQSEAQLTIQNAPQEASNQAEESKESTQVTLAFVNQLIQRRTFNRGEPAAHGGQGASQPIEIPVLSEEEVTELFHKKMGEWRLWGKKKPVKLMERIEWADHYFRDFNNVNKLDWKLARAVCQRKPEEVLNLSAGATQNVELEILNDTLWAWKKGSYLNLADEQPSGAELPIEAFTVNIEQKVKGKTTTTVSVPLTMAQNAAVDNGQVHEIFV